MTVDLIEEDALNMRQVLICLNALMLRTKSSGMIAFKR
jgi:hypothetical protein